MCDVSVWVFCAFVAWDVGCVCIVFGECMQMTVCVVGMRKCIGVDWLRCA